MRSILSFLTAGMLLWGAPLVAQDANDYQSDAESIQAQINEHYAYLDLLPGEKFAPTPQLQEEGENVSDQRELLKYAERVLMLLSDHHVITGSSFRDSWAVVPSYSDLWIERCGDVYRITSVREGSPAAEVGVRAGAMIVSIGKMEIERAVAEFWSDLDVTGTIDDRHAGFAARILAAGRRDRLRTLGISNPGAAVRTLTLPNLYFATTDASNAPIGVAHSDGIVTIRFNNSLGDSATIAAFDAAMAEVPAGAALRLDLRDTPSGGNTSVARAILGWFVSEPTGYQIHNLPAEYRQTGIERQWVEQVLPRDGKYRKSNVSVMVGRWTGSMGEGLAIAFDAIGIPVYGDRMAGLLGAVYDIKLPKTGLMFKLPVERLYAVDGTPREDFVPRPISELHNR